MIDPDKTTGSPGGIPAGGSQHSGMPSLIGRYKIEKVLGEGGFGLVYLAHDDQLQRLVAIKVPHPDLVVDAAHAAAYLAEARTVANLDHPHIVPVFEVGSTEQFPCFIVSKYIDGTDLARRLRQSRLTIHEALELVATVAEALHYAHKRGLVHRDVKPGNLLLERTGKPYLADFGLALPEREVGKGPRYVGSAPYMSPEQARGEGHRVDGRSDIFSLGAVFYELLTGRQPFKGDSQQELLEQVTNFEPRPPRQYDDGITKELERICLKAMSKRSSERYMTAKDLADDLRQYAAEHPVNPQSGSATPSVQPPSTGGASSIIVTPRTPISDTQVIKIVPKGLRSFDAHDADFFLELLPGPRDRNGLPDSIRFWKTRIEERDADNTFSVGLIYGPSGCGKSSLVKAGLLPRLSPDVIAIYVEATAEETETRLLNGLRKHFPALPGNLGLKETLTALRRGQGLLLGKKIVIILDQFEQWLHANQGAPSTELVDALRQCDGARVQCIVMVRDDFWMAVTRFLTGLEVELLQGRNCAAADLFDLDHARRVLTALGRAFGKLPETNRELSSEQKEFLNQVVSGLAQEGKVICIRLALFAEMMKGKTWTPATLKALGGTEGVGVTFLEETFSSPMSNPKHRMYQTAAQAVLKALLPQSGTDIKGHMQSSTALMDASGLANQPDDFESLLRILDSEIRLITPTDREGKERTEGASPIPSGEKYYQLTHDYLVPSLRDWLTRKQKETWRGRAELLLAERATVWNARPENRQLPSLWQWSNIRWLTVQQSWTPPQRKMMHKASRHFAVLWTVIAVAVSLIGWVGYEGRGKLKAQALRDRVLDANTAEVPTIVQEMTAYRRWLSPLLQASLTEARTHQDARKQLHASLALLPVDPTQVDYLLGRLLDATPPEVPVIRDALTPHRESLRVKLWTSVIEPISGKEYQRLRAAAALAKYDPTSQGWMEASPLVVNDLVLESSVYLGQWSEALRPVKNQLIPPLSAIFRDRHPDKAAERSLATNLLADYATDRPQVLAQLVMDADDKQFAVIYPKFKGQGERGVSLLISEIERELPSLALNEGRNELAKRQANAAAVLLKLGQPDKAWPFFKHSTDPTVRSYLIHRLGPIGVDAQVIIDRLGVEPDVSARRALLLCLGEFGADQIPAESRVKLTAKFQDQYRTEADPGLHAAIEWVLRRWQQGSWLKQANEEWVKDQAHRTTRMNSIKQNSTAQNSPPQWYVNGQGQTMILIPGPVEFLMGSPQYETGRQDNELQHRQRIGRTFAIAAKSVTVEQFRQFKHDHVIGAKYAREPDLPVMATSWFESAAYCNWLSKAEGIPEDQWCYETDSEGRVTKPKPNDLNLTGYRLPTEPEFEYATRAGTLSGRYFGEPDELLSKYAWYQKNSQDQTWPVGTLKPNDFGLFDTHGNVFTWSQDRAEAYSTIGSDDAARNHEDLVAGDKPSRILRGSSFFNQPSIVRSAYRYFIVPTIRINYAGFRVARTITP